MIGYQWCLTIPDRSLSAADYGLEQMVSQPTRANNILDIFFTNRPTLVERCSLIPGMSDHDGVPMIIIGARPKVIKTKPRKVFLYGKANIDAIKEDMKQLSEHLASHEAVSHNTSVKDLWALFVEGVNGAMNSHIPTRIANKRNTTPWIGTKIKRLLKKKQRAFNYRHKVRDRPSIDRFHELRRVTHRATRKARREFINSFCFDSCKKFWSFMKSLRTDSVGIPTLKSFNGSLESDNSVKASILNDQFKSVFTQEHDVLPSLGNSKYPTIPDIDITLNGIVKLLHDLNPHKAPGPDGVPAFVLKVAAAEIAPSLCLIFQKSLETGELPSDWLKANISPIFKKGDRTIASNYRPVSLTSICCKVLEHVVHSHIMLHFDKHSVLTSKQHGFRRNHSCETQLLLTTHDLTLSLDNRKQTDLIIMDFSKAFDSVPHNRLLLKLDHYGVRNKTHRWIANFLQHRKQRVVVGGEHSAWTDVLSGVPQGTVLGPLLFLAYINDLPLNIQSEMRLFADDCVMYRQIVNQFDHDQLQDDLDTLAQWQKDWQLHFNSEKCFVMRISHSRAPKLFDYRLGTDILVETHCHPYLGVDISNNLSWSTHINRISSSASKQLGFIRRNLFSCTRQIKQTAYTSLVRPHIEYACSVWDPHQKNLINKIEMVQRRAARFVMNDYNSTSSVSAMLKELDWSSLQNRRTASRLSILHRAREGILPLPVENLLLPLQRPSRHSHQNSYQILSVNKNCYKYSFWPKTIIDWNSLPHHLTVINDSKTFKQQVIKHLKQHQ